MNGELVNDMGPPRFLSKTCLPAICQCNGHLQLLILTPRAVVPENTSHCSCNLAEFAEG
jgi:hypothetical protein